MYLHFKFLDSAFPNEFLDQRSKLLYNCDIEQDYENVKLIGEFKKVNLFVGANNSGKSRFLRGLIKLKIPALEISSSKTSFKKMIENFKEFYNLNYNKLHVSYKNSINPDFKALQLWRQDYINFTRNYSNVKENFSNLRELRDGIITSNKAINIYAKNALNFLNELLKIENEILFINNSKSNTNNYIPTLRTIHVNEHLKKGVIKQTINKNYGIQNNVYSGLELFDQVHDFKNSTTENRRKVKKFERFLSKYFFNNKEIEITSDAKTKDILFSINDIEYPIYNLGDGIQSLIIVLFPIFLANNNDWIFIEEPEINLHPSLQRIFIEAILNDDYLNKKNLKYFITTHSNHFLDITLSDDNISIFQFQKEANTFSIKTNVKPNKEVLDLLGVNTSSVFLANTSIWIEGPTDRKYISKILKLFAKEKNFSPFKEDIDFAFFEYGGNLIEHYLFDDSLEFNEEEVRNKINTFSLANKIFLLADNDNADGRSAKGKRRKELEELSRKQENFLYMNTINKEIENLLPEIIISEFLLELVKEPNRFLKEIKSINTNLQEYKDKGLGDYYEGILLNSGIPKKNLKSFKAPSGTLMNDYKIKLVNMTINSGYKYSDFIKNNDELKKIIESLVKFIKD